MKKAEINERKYLEAQKEVQGHKNKTSEFEAEAQRLRRKIYNLESEKEETAD
jgi:hypothetical protein